MSSSVLALTLVVVILVYRILWLRHQAYRPLLLIGHLPYFALQSRQKSLEWIVAATNYYQGRSWRLEIPGIGKGWVVEDPACVKYVLSTRHDAFGKGELAMSRMKDLFGDGIILVHGPLWKSQRLAGHAALSSPSNLRFFLDRILPLHLEPLFSRFDKAVKGKSKIDFQEQAYIYAMDVFGDLAYDSNFQKISARFAGPFDDAAIVTQSRFFNPLYLLTEFILPYGRKFKKDVSMVKGFGSELVKEGVERARSIEEGQSHGVLAESDNDSRGMLLRELIKTHGGESRQDIEFLADSCLNFLTAGRDTTAQALTWIIYLLLRHPDALVTCTKELHASSSPHLPSISLADLTSSISPTSYCPFTNAVISEALRIHPPVPMEMHENTTDSPLLMPDGTVVQQGEKVVWSPWAMGRSTRIWGEDALSFRPERWLPTKEADSVDRNHPSKKTAFENPVFHGGPRSCLGKQLAKIELIFVLRELLLRYQFENAWGGGEREVGDGLTGPVRDGLPVRVIST